MSKDTEMESRWEHFLFSTSNQKANHYFVNGNFLQEHCAFRSLNGRKRWGHVTWLAVRMKKRSEDYISDAQYKPKSYISEPINSCSLQHRYCHFGFINSLMHRTFHLKAHTPKGIHHLD